ncbi:MAG: PilZ domain-containing protein [Treponema sp.]|jgi:c-di-GMP-binding flagellar brake protein YcgR|nr:PilZ domain-containing protein [Treponema sp.]
MPFFTLFVVVAVLGVVMFIISRPKKEKQASWIQFFAKGKDAGFSFKEIELLRRLAAKCNIADPASLFWSQNQLDLCIRSLVRSIRMTGEDEDQGSQDFLSKLYDYRKKIEMEKPKVKKGISSSRQIGEGQYLRILVSGTGVFKSQIVKNVNQYLTISRPVNTKIPAAFSWTGTKISVYFWRENDAGYVFDSEVQDEVFSKGISSLKIAHSDSLFRTQKRKSVRIKLHKSAFLYLMGPDEEPGRLEVSPGLKCFLEDLSDSGCAVAVGGKAQTGLRVKVQFALDNTAVSMSGTVRSVEFKEDVNRSVLHIEAEPLPLEIRNQILGQVFGMLPEEEEELPFRILDEEAEGMSVQGAGGDDGAEAVQESV